MKSASVAVLRLSGMNVYCARRATSFASTYLPISFSNCAHDFHGRYSSNSCAIRLPAPGTSRISSAGRGVEVDVDECALVDLVGLFLRELLREQELVEVDNAVERPRGHDRLRDRRRHARQLGQVGFGDGVGVDDAERLADLSGGGNSEEQGECERESRVMVAP